MPAGVEDFRGIPAGRDYLTGYQIVFLNTIVGEVGIFSENFRVTEKFRLNRPKDL